jgi:23S rRNA pseudouridine2605 synthase
MHPRYEIERRYSVRLLGGLPDEAIEQLRRGVLLDDGPAKFDDIARGGGTGSNIWYEVSLREGRNREVRRLFDAVGVAVSRLIRIRFGPVRLSGLRRGQYRELSRAESRALYAAVGLRRDAR